MSNSSYYLDPDAIKSQSDSAIQALESSIDQLQKIESSMEEFIGADEIKSEKFDGMKQQISDYRMIIRAIITANESEIADHNTLKSAVGTEVLDGNVIEEGKELSKSSYEDNSEQAANYTTKALHNTLNSVLHIYYSWKAFSYWNLAENAQNAYDAWCEKEEAYYAIQTSTKGLFTSSEALRTAAGSGLSELAGAFRDGTFMPDLMAPWRQKMADAYMNRLRTIDQNGVVTVKWAEVEKIMKKDAGDITDEEYSYLAALYITMEEKDIPHFLQLCMDRKEDVNCPAFIEFVGPSMGVFSEDYSEWIVNKEKTDRILGKVEVLADILLFSQQNLDIEKSDSELDNMQKVRNEVLQRGALMAAVQEVEFFRGEYKADYPHITIERQEQKLILGFKEFRNMGSAYAPMRRDLGDSYVTVYPTVNGVNIDDLALDITEQTILGRFSVPSLSGEAAELISEEAMDAATDKIAVWAAEETAAETMGLIPYIGDAAGLFMGYTIEKERAEENIEVTKEAFESLRQARIFSNFDCSAVYITYDTYGDIPATLKINEGRTTVEIIERVNDWCETDITIDELFTDPQSVIEKVDGKGDSYNNAIHY